MEWTWWQIIVVVLLAANAIGLILQWSPLKLFDHFNLSWVLPRFRGRFD